MDRPTRSVLEQMTQEVRRLLEKEFSEQLEGLYDIPASGKIPPKAGEHLSPAQAAVRRKLIEAIEHKTAVGMEAVAAVSDFVRDSAFTLLNRYAALKMLESRGLVQECVSRGEESSGVREFAGLAPGLQVLPDRAGYWLYLDCLLDELSTEIKVLFDPRDPSSLLKPRKAALDLLLAAMNDARLRDAWKEDETIGWIYQYFNSQDERRSMREESATPKNGRELAVRNQFFTPRYVVRFLVDNTLGRTWHEMQAGNSAIKDRCSYLFVPPDERFVNAEQKVEETVPRGIAQEALWARPVEVRRREPKDPRDLKILDPACGSGHFLLYSFDLLVAMYEEAWKQGLKAEGAAYPKSLQEEYPDASAFHAALPGLILERNLYGVDIDPRCAQIAQLALWMRTQRAYQEFGIRPAERPRIRHTNIVVAEPIPNDAELLKEFVRESGKDAGALLKSLLEQMALAGELGLLGRYEAAIPSGLFGNDEGELRRLLGEYVRKARSTDRLRRRLFAGDAEQGIGLLGLARMKYDVVLMNPPFGAVAAASKKVFESDYPNSKCDIFAAFVERGIELLQPAGLLGAITSRQGFFLSSFQRWRSEVLLGEAMPKAIADLGGGVLDGAMVETAAYCLEARA